MNEIATAYRYSPRQAPIHVQMISCPGDYVSKYTHMHHLNELILIPGHARAHLFSNGNRVSFQAPALVFHRAGSYHSLNTEGAGEEGYSCICIYFSDQHVKQIPEALLHSSVLFNDDCTVLELRDEDVRCLSRYTALLDPQRDSADKSLFILLIILDEMYCLLKKRPVHRLNTANGYIFNVVQFLIDHSMETLTTTQIAAHFHVSVSKINNDFHKITGQTLNRFCADIRLNRAAEILLAHPDMPISEVAYSCGYSSESYFIQSFQKDRGITPRAYRKMHEIP